MAKCRKSKRTINKNEYQWGFLCDKIISYQFIVVIALVWVVLQRFNYIVDHFFFCLKLLRCEMVLCVFLVLVSIAICRVGCETELPQFSWFQGDVSCFPEPSLLRRNLSNCIIVLKRCNPLAQFSTVKNRRMCFFEVLHTQSR